MTGQIDLWIDLGQPYEPYLRCACVRAREVIVLQMMSGEAVPIGLTKRQG